MLHEQSPSWLHSGSVIFGGYTSMDPLSTMFGFCIIVFTVNPKKEARNRPLLKPFKLGLQVLRLRKNVARNYTIIYYALRLSTKTLKFLRSISPSAVTTLAVTM